MLGPAVIPLWKFLTKEKKNKVKKKKIKVMKKKIKVKKKKYRSRKKCTSLFLQNQRAGENGGVFEQVCYFLKRKETLKLCRV